MTFDVEGDAPPESSASWWSAKARSAVFDIVTNGVPVHVGVEA